MYTGTPVRVEKFDKESLKFINRHLTKSRKNMVICTSKYVFFHVILTVRIGQNSGNLYENAYSLFIRLRYFVENGHAWFYAMYGRKLSRKLLIIQCHYVKY